MQSLSGLRGGSGFFFQTGFGSGFDSRYSTPSENDNRKAKQNYNSVFLSDMGSEVESWKKQEKKEYFTVASKLLFLVHILSVRNFRFFFTSYTVKVKIVGSFRN
jgi:hypothetical protein